jgi:putative phosphoesterase
VILHAGDFVALEVLEELSRLAPVAAVHGNVDEAALQTLLPARRVVEVGEARLGLVHDGGPASGRETRLVDAFPGCDGVVYGHSHLPQLSSQRGVWVLNPGSPTDRRRAPAHTMIRLRVDGSRLEPRLLDVG